MAEERVLLIGLLCVSLSFLFLPAPVLGMSLRLMSDWAYTQTNSEREVREMEGVEKSESNRFQQTYRVDLSKQLFPTLNMNGGVQVEQNRNSSETVGDAETTNRDQQILPYVDLEWRNPLYSLSGGYRERYARSEGSSLAGTEKDHVTSYNLRGEWRPVEFPRLELNYLHSERTDDPLTTDSESDTWLLNSRYEYRDYEFRYNYLRGEDSNNNIETETLTETLTETHSGRVGLNRRYLDGRLTLNASLRMEYSSQEFGSNKALVEVDIGLDGDGFFLLTSDSVPDEDADYSKFDDFSSVELDLGVVPSKKNLALAITLPAQNKYVDRIDAKIGDGTFDQAIIQDIENPANWAIYVRDNNENWQLRIPTIGTPTKNIDFNQEINIIKIKFSEQIEVPKHILLVYSGPAADSVEITGINAIDIVEVAEGTTLSNQTYQAQFGLGWQASEATRLGYTFNLQERRSSLFGERNTRVNNGLSISHIFNHIFSGAGRFATGHSWDQGQLDTSNYSYSARLNGRYLDTLNQSLIYSGSLQQDEKDGDSTTNSLILRTNAALYDGWDLSFDQGTTLQNSDRDGESTNYFVRLQTSITPHSSYNLITEYSINWAQDDLGTERSDSARLRAFWVPRDTLSFSGEVRLRRSAEDDQLSWKASASWLPLRDGSLQCALAYSEEEDQDGHRTWSFSPNLSWEVAHYANLSLRYSRGEQETDIDITTFETAFLNFRIFYD